jgi:hypothetical protein
MVFVLDRKKKPLMPCAEKRARQLLERGRARVHRMHPFTIRLVDRTVEASALQPPRLKLDPGSKVTGMAAVREDAQNPSAQTVLHLAELTHRCERIKKALDQRRAYRRNRRSQHTLPRATIPGPPAGRKAPWRHLYGTGIKPEPGSSYRALCPITEITVEAVRSDT